MPEFSDVVMNDGKLLEGEKIGELVKYIINKFAKENLTRNEAIEILDRTKECTGDAAVIREVDQRFSLQSVLKNCCGLRMQNRFDRIRKK